MKNLRIYIATQVGCEPCEITKKTLGKEIFGVPVYEVDLSSSPKRAESMAVFATPTIFIVQGNDDNGNDIFEQSEEKYVWHQEGMIADKGNIEAYIKHLKNGNRISTPLK